MSSKIIVSKYLSLDGALQDPVINIEILKAAIRYGFGAQDEEDDLI
jgi:hypothetical protein